LVQVEQKQHLEQTLAVTLTSALALQYISMPEVAEVADLFGRVLPPAVGLAPTTALETPAEVVAGVSVGLPCHGWAHH
tara:strand:+ start:369 stop:602 length:234 start_codon:yes stop_codon:yes gene_type:complete